jgi:hypothetical protein
MKIAHPSLAKGLEPSQHSRVASIVRNFADLLRVLLSF